MVCESPASSVLEDLGYTGKIVELGGDGGGRDGLELAKSPQQSFA